MTACSNCGNDGLINDIYEVWCIDCGVIIMEKELESDD
jgi:transcription initiation factor TFIIIB Brf1 subunit/transcription initiation factor TFIIB